MLRSRSLTNTVTYLLLSQQSSLSAPAYQARHYAKMAAAQPTKGAKQFESRLTVMTNKPHKNIHSLASIGDPYIPEVFKRQQSSLFSIAGLKERQQRLKKFWANLMCLAALARKFGWKSAVSKSEQQEAVLKLYKNVMESFYRKDTQELREYCTERVFGELKHDIKQIRSGEPIYNFEISKVKQFSHVYDFKANFKQVNAKVLFVQRTYKLVTDQILTPRFGGPNSAEPKQLNDVTEYIVIERNLADPTSTWRYAGKIDTNKRYVAPALGELLLAPQEFKNEISK